MGNYIISPIMAPNYSPTRAASMARIPSLDGLRALSIFLVMALHALQRYSSTHSVATVWYGIFNGDAGVYIFFVISGYLITRILLNEHQKRGSISLRGFYLRRAMRILPPLYAYVGVLLLLGWAGRLVIAKLDIVSALFFFHNYVSDSMWTLEHFWSLSTEEQFYFIWPCILLCCLRRPGLAGRLLASRIALAVIFFSPFVRVVSFKMHNPYIHNGYGYHMRADSLMFGCVVALLEFTPRFERIYLFATKIWWITPVAILLFNYLDARFQNYWKLPFGYTLSGVAIAFFLLWCVRNPGSVVGRLLNSRPIARIGVLSYSMYLWQTLFIHDGNASIFGPHLKILTLFPFNWLAIFVVAELSYYLVEQPSLRLRNRLIGMFHLYLAGRSSRQVV
jgi:peptidoglycan/LPS O-acetylase OafA/YrhL